MVVGPGPARPGPYPPAGRWMTGPQAPWATTASGFPDQRDRGAAPLRGRQLLEPGDQLVHPLGRQHALAAGLPPLDPQEPAFLDVARAHLAEGAGELNRGRQLGAPAFGEGDL